MENHNRSAVGSLFLCAVSSQNVNEFNLYLRSFYELKLGVCKRKFWHQNQVILSIQFKGKGHGIKVLKINRKICEINSNGFSLNGVLLCGFDVFLSIAFSAYTDTEMC